MFNLNAKKLLMSGCVFSVVTVVIIALVYTFYVKNNKKAKELFTSPKELIFFKANWCGHCQRFKPVWDEVVSECNKQDKYSHLRLTELDIDTDSAKPLMQKHNVRGFPHVVLVSEEGSDDKVFQRNRTKEELLAFLDENL